VAWAEISFFYYYYYKCCTFFFNFTVFSGKKKNVKENEEYLGTLILKLLFLKMESSQSLNYQQTFGDD
jgi:hypothetical protein